MKAVYFVACCVAVALGQATTATPGTTKAPATTLIKDLCSSEQINEIHALESTASYNACRNDAQKQIFDGRPDDICAVNTCVVAVQNLVGKYPRCVFDTRVPANDLQAYIVECKIDPKKTTAPETTTVKPKATVAPTPNVTVDDTITVTTTSVPSETRATKSPPTTIPSSSATVASIAFTASAALIYSMI